MWVPQKESFVRESPKNEGSGRGSLSSTLYMLPAAPEPWNRPHASAASENNFTGRRL